MKRKAIVAALSLAAFSVCLCFAEERTEPKKAALPVILNLVPGLGIGSFIQGDPAGGLVGLGGEVAGLGLCGYGVVYSYAYLFGAAFTGALGGDTSELSTKMEVSIWCAIGGAALWTGTKVFELVRPIVYARRFNEERGRVSAFLSPDLVSDGKGGFDPGLSLRLAF